MRRMTTEPLPNTACPTIRWATTLREVSGGVVVVHVPPWSIPSRRYAKAFGTMGPRRYYLPLGIRYDCCILPDILDSTSGLLDDLLGILHSVKNGSGCDTRPLSTNRLIEAMTGIPSELAVRYRLWGNAPIRDGDMGHHRHQKEAKNLAMLTVVHEPSRPAWPTMSINRSMACPRSLGSSCSSSPVSHSSSVSACRSLKDSSYPMVRTPSGDSVPFSSGHRAAVTSRSIGRSRSGTCAAMVNSLSPVREGLRNHGATSLLPSPRHSLRLLHSARHT